MPLQRVRAVSCMSKKRRGLEELCLNAKPPVRLPVLLTSADFCKIELIMTIICFSIKACRQVSDLIELMF